MHSFEREICAVVVIHQWAVLCIIMFLQFLEWLSHLWSCVEETCKTSLSVLAISTIDARQLLSKKQNKKTLQNTASGTIQDTASRIILLTGPKEEGQLAPVLQPFGSRSLSLFSLLSFLSHRPVGSLMMFILRIPSQRLLGLQLAWVTWWVAWADHETCTVLLTESQCSIQMVLKLLFLIVA